MEEKDFYLKYNLAKDNLNLIIKFINNCDTKVSIILGVYGVIFTIFLTNLNIFNYLNINKFDIFYLFILIFSIILIFSGIICFFYVLFPRININRYKSKKNICINSNIFYRTISNKSYDEYLNSIKSENYNVLNDLHSQIYINSKICTIKFRYYKIGLILSASGFLLLFIIIIKEVLI